MEEERKQSHPMTLLNVFIFRTPLHWAAATGRNEAVGALLELNANPAPVDAEGATPCDYARQANHQGISVFIFIEGKWE